MQYLSVSHNAVLCKIRSRGKFITHEIELIFMGIVGGALLYFCHNYPNYVASETKLSSKVVGLNSS